MNQMAYNRHYISVDGQNRIVDGFSDAFRQPTQADICIDEQGGYQFRLFRSGKENQVLTDLYGIPLYKWDGRQVLRRSAQELAADLAALPAPEAPFAAKQRVEALEAAVDAMKQAWDALLERFGIA